MFLYYLLLFFCNLNIIYLFNLSPKFPIIFNDPSGQKGSYFGFAVHLRRGVDQYLSSIVIGAPNANSSFTAHSDIVEPGVVYQCDIDEYVEPPTCYPLLLDSKGEVTGSFLTNLYKHRKTHAWLGATLDGQNTRAGRLVICAPRWANQYYQKEWLNNGLCYWLPDTIDANRTANMLMPLLDRNLRYFENKAKQRKHYGYAFGEAGFSVHIPKSDGSEVLLGAPGINSWMGSVVWHRDTQNINEFSSKPLGDVHVLKTNKKRFKFESYFGYSLSSGKFVSYEPDKIYFVGGAPRDSNYNGKVFLIELRNAKVFQKHEIRIMKELVGQQMGEYFGASLCVVDVNGDGLDDVIVGAPRHSLNSNFDDVGDEGTVYVFLNEDYWKFEKQSNLQFAQDIGSQFGTSISSLGDLDQDGYNDIVVGAPYEDEGRGAIYIYMGSPKGLKPVASQHIKARNVDYDLLSFGYSLSRGVDIDSNFYNDLVVGAYQSGTVVLFRSQPVARLKGHIRPSVQEISIHKTEFDVKFCVSYDGYPDTINVNLNVYADSVYKRAVFLLADCTYNSVIQKVISVNYDNEYCEDMPLQIRVLDQDFSKPIGISMSYSLDSVASAGFQSFCATCPVLDPNSDNFVEVRIPYITGCGSDNKCTPDLKLTAEFLNNVFVIGSNGSVKMRIGVDNFGEPAFLTRLFLNISSDLTLVEVPSYCNKLENEPWVCELGNILTKDEQKNLVLELDTLNIASGSEVIKVNMSVTSMGEEQQEYDNWENITLPILTISQLAINGKSIPEQLQYKNDQNELKSTQLTISQEYEIRNFGPSPVAASLVQFFIPVIYNNVVLFKVLEPETSFEKQSLVCNATDPGFSVITDDSSGDFSEAQERDRRSLTTENNQIQKGDVSTAQKNVFPTNRTLFLNCSHLEPLISCMTVTCSVGLLKDPQIGAKIKLYFQAQLENIERVLEKKDITQFDVNAVVTALVKVDTDSGGQAVITVGSTLIGSQSTPAVPTLWIALAIALGLLILVLVTTALMKMGFFKRNTKEKLELLKEQDDFQGSILPVDLVCKQIPPTSTTKTE